MKFINKYYTNQQNLEKFNIYLNDSENEDGLSFKSGRTISDDESLFESSDEENYEEIKNILSKNQYLNNERFLQSRFVDLNRLPPVFEKKKYLKRPNLSVNNIHVNQNVNTNNSYLNQHLKKSQTQISKYREPINKSIQTKIQKNEILNDLNKNEAYLSLKINIYLDRFKKCMFLEKSFFS